MKKTFKLLHWLSQNNIKFSIEELNEDGDLIIKTDKIEFTTWEDCHQVDILNEDGTETAFEIEELKTK